MGQGTKIEWAHHSFNPWWGCQKVSPACANCYAEGVADRFHPDLKLWGPDSTRKLASETSWREPLKWNNFAKSRGVRARVFCGSMCDVMDGRSELTASRLRLYDLIEQTESLDWLLLTKRPDNFGLLLPESWLSNPRRNVWLGTTAENQEWWDKRIPALRKTPAACRFVSVEPMLGPVLGEVDGIDWVICGGESGRGARPMHPDWARSLRDQCQAAGVPFLFKQWGEWEPIVTTTGELESPFGYHVESKLGFVNVGKKAAGRLLDGREWHQFPEVRR